MNKIISRINNDIEKIKVIKSEVEDILCNSNFLKISRGKYYLNNNRIIERECIQNKIGNGHAVCIFAVTNDNKILLVIQPRVVLKNNTGINIEVPAGYVEIGEDPIKAGLRELQEETGFTSNNIIKIDSYHTSIGFSNEITELLIATNCRKISNQQLDNDEVIIVEEVSLEEFEYLLKENYILDINTKMGYYRYLDYLKKEKNNEKNTKKKNK